MPQDLCYQRLYREPLARPMCLMMTSRDALDHPHSNRHTDTRHFNEQTGIRTGKLKDVCSCLWENHRRATKHHLPYGITVTRLTQPDKPVLDLPIPGG